MTRSGLKHPARRFVVVAVGLLQLPPRALIWVFDTASRVTEKGAVLSTLFLWLFLTGCTTYQKKVVGARNMLESGNASEAVEKLRPLAQEEGRDQLVYLMDYGLALHLNGQYEESNKVFLRAADLAQFKDYISISKEVASVVLTEELTQYKGEHYENLIIHVYLALNFIMLNEMDSAMVEVRRINEKMEKYRFDEEKFAQQNVLAHYFSGIIWEAQENYDSAFIEYEKAYKLNSSIEQLRVDLMRSAYLADRTKAFRKYKKMYPDQVDTKLWDRSQKMGEIVVFFQQGWAPRKEPNPNFVRVPRLRPIRSAIDSAQLHLVDTDEYIESRSIYSVENVAMNTLAKDLDTLVAKRIGGIAAKAVVADQISQKNKLLGQLSWIAMNLSDRADVRQWSTLPESFQLIRVPMEPGTHQVEIRGLAYSGVPLEKRQESVVVEAGRPTFLVWRTFK